MRFSEWGAPRIVWIEIAPDSYRCATAKLFPNHRGLRGAMDFTELNKTVRKVAPKANKVDIETIGDGAKTWVAEHDTVANRVTSDRDKNVKVRK